MSWTARARRRGGPPRIRGDRGGRGPGPHRRLAPPAQDPRPDLADGRGPSRSANARSAPGGSTRATPGSPSGPADPPRRSTRSSATSSSTGPRRSSPEDVPRSRRRHRLVPSRTGFYSSTNMRTEVRLGWPLGRGARDQEMDCGIVRSTRPRTDRPMRADARRPARGDADRRRPRRAPGRPDRASPRGRACSASWARASPARSPRRSASEAWPSRSGPPGRPGRRSCSSAVPAIVHTGSAPARRPAHPRGVGSRPSSPATPWLHARHRAGDLRDQPRRLDRPRRGDRARPRAPPPDDQLHPAPGRDPGGGRLGPDQIGDHVRGDQARASTSSSPARSATTGRSPRSSPTRSGRRP